MQANLVELNPNPILRLNSEGRVLYANPAARDLLDSASPGGAPGILAALQPTPGPPPGSLILKAGDCTYHFTLLPDPESAGVLAFGQDITTQRRLEAADREQRTSFVARLAEELADLTDAQQVARHTVRRLADFMGVDRCLVSEIVHEQVRIVADYPPSLPDLEEAYPLSIFPAGLLAALRDDRPTVITDVRTDARLHADAAAGVLPDWLGAFISTPGFREGRWQGSLTVISRTPRPWQADELDLVRRVNDLLWLSIEKTRLQIMNRWSERLFARLLHEIPAGIAFLSGPEHRFTLINPAFKRIIDGRDEVIGHPFAEIWPEIAGEWTSIFDSVYNTGEPFYRDNLAARIQRDGRSLDVSFQVSITLLTDPGDEVSGLLLMLQEITTEVNARKEIQEERARLKALVEHSPVGVVLTDDAGRVVLANPAAQRMYARPVPMGEPYSSHAVLELCRPDGAPFDPRDLPLTRAALDGEVTINLDMVIVWPDGQRRPLLVSAAPARDPDGRLIGAVGIFMDISEHIELRDRLAYQAQVLDTVHDAIIATDANLIITSWNRAAENLYGWSAAEMIGTRAWRDLIPDGDETERAGAFKRMLAGEALTGDRVHHHRDGRRLFVNLSVSVMKDSTGKLHGYTAAVRDVTDRRNAEVALRRYAARLERSNRDLEDFAFIASHDMQEPLRKVRAFGELLKTAYREQLDERGADYVNRMVNAAVRMQHMLDSLLTYSRVSTRGQPFEPVDLNAAVAAALEDLDNRLEASGGVVEVGPLPTIEADPQQIEQIFHNLIGNALKFHPPDASPQVRIAGRLLPGDLAEITVSDRGVGFPMEFADRLFQPFQRLHGRSAFEGSGVGLAICRKIAERHGGYITGHSAPGEGATFVLTLPVKPAAT